MFTNKSWTCPMNNIIFFGAVIKYQWIQINFKTNIDLCVCGNHAPPYNYTTILLCGHVAEQQWWTDRLLLDRSEVLPVRVVLIHDRQGLTWKSRFNYMNHHNMNHHVVNHHDMNPHDMDHHKVNHHGMNHHTVNHNDISHHDMNHHDMNYDMNHHDMNHHDVNHHDMSHPDMNHHEYDMNHHDMSHHDMSHHDMNHHEFMILIQRTWNLNSMNFRCV